MPVEYTGDNLRAVCADIYAGLRAAGRSGTIYTRPGEDGAVLLSTAAHARQPPLEFKAGDTVTYHPTQGPIIDSGYVEADLTTGTSVPVSRERAYDVEFLAREPITPARQAQVDRLAVQAGYLPKRDAIDFVNMRAAQMFGPPLDGVTADQLYRGRSGR